MDRLTGDHRRHGVATVHRDSIHNPGHDLGVGIHIRCRNIPLRTEQNTDLSGKTPRQTLKLTQRELTWFNDNTTLRPTVGNIDQRTLPGHPHREGTHLVDVDTGVVADPTLDWATTQVVLNTVAGKNFYRAIIEFDGKVDRQLALGYTQDRVYAISEPEQFGSGVELLLGDLKRVLLRRHCLASLN